MANLRDAMRPVGLASVMIEDPFWSPRRQVNRRQVLLHEYRMLKETGRIDQYRLDWKPGDPNPPHIFWDSDVAKWIEAAAYSLATHPDADLDRLLNEVIGLVASAQQADGYLNPHYTVVEPGKRWTNLRDCHEMYCAGHMIEAGVAHFECTGKRTLLEVVCKLADCIDNTFGPGKRAGYCGHEEIELALAKLHRVTGEGRYLRLAEYFLNERGTQPHVFDTEAVQRGEAPKKHWAGGDHAYYQAHMPVREQAEAVGHAVRAMYLYSAMADVGRETADKALLAACRTLWQDVVGRKMYVTGGVGSEHRGEAFTKAYDLPNESAYAETCAAIGLVFFAHRMLQIEGDSQYADVMERALYNGVLSGVSADGRTFFYVNPLASRGNHHRQEWFGCACCPPNIARILASLGQYVYSARQEALYVHLYVAGQARAQVAGQTVTLRQEGQYPWHGRMRITLDVAQPTKFDLMLRVPGWCRRHTVKINGKAVGRRISKGYVRLGRRWQAGDVVDLSLQMPIERIVAHPHVEQDAGKVALQRGPVVYCLEQCDHKADVRSIRLRDRAELKACFEKRLLGGAVVIEGETQAWDQSAWNDQLYQPIGQAEVRPAKIRAIPYCLWDNRQAGAMTVWMTRG
jgi:uncharacterized protein